MTTNWTKAKFLIRQNGLDKSRAAKRSIPEYKILNFILTEECVAKWIIGLILVNFCKYQIDNVYLFIIL